MELWLSGTSFIVRVSFVYEVVPYVHLYVSQNSNVYSAKKQFTFSLATTYAIKLSINTDSKSGSIYVEIYSNNAIVSKMTVDRLPDVFVAKDFLQQSSLVLSQSNIVINETNIISRRDLRAANSSSVLVVYSLDATALNTTTGTTNSYAASPSVSGSAVVLIVVFIALVMFFLFVVFIIAVIVILAIRYRRSRSKINQYSPNPGYELGMEH
ncbi:Cdon [Acrasis kona]|uniref:Cdon n=1 Tax=Acrasis kona TaxID=1008807 RepID=A0AAW2Z8E1_9EUKA